MQTQSTHQKSAVNQSAEAYKQASDNRKLAHIPGNYGLPIFGRSLETLRDLLGFLIRQHAQYGPVSRMQMGLQRQVLVLGPDLNQKVLLDKERNYSNQMGYEFAMGPFFGGGLMLRDFGEHRMHRRIMQTAFKTDTLKSYIPIINPMMSESIANWHQQSDFHFYPAIKETLLRIAADIFIGVKNPGQELEKMNEAFLDTVDGLRHLIRLDLPGLTYHKGIKGRNYLHGVFRQMLPEKRTAEGSDMFSFFAKERDENGELFSDDDVVRHIHFLMMAAHDTTTSALSNCVAALVSHPEWQQRLRKEALALGKPTLDYDDLDQQQDLELFMFEVLRLHGPVPMSMRRTLNEVELGGYRLPPHTVIAIAPAFTHYMEDWWDNAYKFDPERFGPERAEHKRHSFNYIPFGGGAHKCIGLHFAMMQIKCFLHQFVLRYDAKLPEDYKLPIVFQDVPFPHPKDQLPLRLTPLN